MHRDRSGVLDLEAQEGFAPLRSDAVFEVVSRSTDLSAVRMKMQAYIANGARLALLVDPYRRAVEVSAPDQRTRIHELPQPISFPAVLPGFILHLEPIIA